MVASDGIMLDDIHVLDGQLRGLLQTALSENPRLEWAWSQSRSSFERVQQERSLPDLQLNYRYFVSPPEPRVGPQEHMFELSQTVPWGGKRRLQAERAEHLATSRTWEAEDLQREVVADIKRTYYEVAYLQESLRVNEEESELLRRFESIALKRYATGQGIQQSVVKVQTEISRLNERRSSIRERLDVMSRRLAERIGRPESLLELDPIELTFPDLDLDGDELERAARVEHPRVRAIEGRIAGDRALADRRELESRPDFRFGLGYTIVGDREDLAGRLNPPEGNGDDILGLTFGINLPVYRGRIRSGVAEAQASEQTARHLLASVQDRLRYEVQEAILEVDSLTDRARLYRDVIVPQAETSLASAEAAYTTDRLGFLDLLDAERVLFQSRLAYHRLLADRWIALADLELFTARAIPKPDNEGEVLSAFSTGRLR
jgi:outer membrane protein TolC